MKYVWDEKKNAANIRKHGIAFGRAIAIFDGPTLELMDDRFDYGETRYQAVGLIDGKEVFVAYSEEEEGVRRIISARGATRKEREAFWRLSSPPER